MSDIHPALHVDVLSARGRRIADEFFNLRRDISVGRSPDNAIVLPDEHAPAKLPLFHRSRKGFELHRSDDVTGYIRRSNEEPWEQLSELNDRDVELYEGARGRLDVGDETLVFEVVAAPEPLPLARRWPSLVLMIIAAGLLAIFLSWLFAAPAH